MSAGRSQYSRWSTGTKLLALLSIALLPLGLAIAWTAQMAVNDARDAVSDDRLEDSKQIAGAIGGVVDRNALALRIAANGVIGVRTDPCRTVQAALAGSSDLTGRFGLRSSEGKLLCTHNTTTVSNDPVIPPPGQTHLWIGTQPPSLYYRVGVEGGAATGRLDLNDLKNAIGDLGSSAALIDVANDNGRIVITDNRAKFPGQDFTTRAIKIGNGDLWVDVSLPTPGFNIFDRLTILLPILMWFVAAVLSWFVVRKLLLNPLAKLDRVVSDYQPGPDRLVLPERLGSASEIRSLGASFERAVDRIEQSEHQMAEALAGQRRLVREVHHRVKNNLQVIASLLNIHGRSATTPESIAAYAAITRRVDALSVVHRNHFAEVEESRGIALRPLLVELAAILRASSPDKAHPLTLQLDVDPLHTTQDAAVAVAFFVTEVAEYAMLKDPKHAIEVDLRRVSELAAVLTVSGQALVEDKGGDAEAREREQFERVVTGLARQLRSPLENKLGRLSVNVAVFPNYD